MIIAKLKAGLGNQLFMYATARCLAHRRNTELKLDITYWQGREGRHHNLYALDKFNIQENFATLEEVQNATLIEDSDIGHFLPEILDAPDNTILQGFWQTEKYFIEIEDIIRREFTLKNPLGKNSAAWEEKILAANCAVSIHVRHGDYLTYNLRNNYGLFPPKYYQDCIDELRKDFPNVTVFVFSDDLQWCKENLKFDVPTYFVEGCELAAEEIYLMSICKHNIISRGTFAWWGAWLNQNPDKKVFAPERWFKTDTQPRDTVPESWVKVPDNYPLWTPPMLSIIVYVENNFPAVGFTMASIFSQDFKDYEVILIDAATDESDEVCMYVSKQNHFKVYKTTTKKFTSWNYALSVARGDYVLFFMSGDFLLLSTVQKISKTCDHFLYMYADNRLDYMTYENFRNYLPDIICPNQRLVEDDNGSIDMNNMKNKKFSVKVDAAFKDINGINELYVPAAQKLIALGTQDINNFVGTKFFKREFLNANKIRFNESIDADSELAFITESFLKTNQIVLVPGALCGQIDLTKISMRVGVIGCGRWGSFHAWYASRIGHRVMLYGRADSANMQRLESTGGNEYLTLPEDVQLTKNLDEVLNFADVIIISVGAQNLRGLIKEINSALKNNLGEKIFVLCMKGLERGTGKRLTEVFIEENNSAQEKIAVWVGPGHVQDFLGEIPNCMVMSSSNENLTRRLVDIFKSPLIRFYYGKDLIGTEIGAAAKNVIGIAAGMLDGLGYTSLKGALMARGAAELSRLIEALGGDKMTVYGLSHLGDYEATLFSAHSHNRRFGEDFVQHKSFDKLAEGVDTVAALIQLAESVGVELPISEAVYKILYEGGEPKEELTKLFLRTTKEE